eukprot:SAG31_NODE_1136_length_9734_cov_4.139595_2_plen_209_part_00
MIRNPNQNKTIAKPQPWINAGLRIVGEGISRSVIVAQCESGAGCMDSVIYYQGNELAPDLEGVTAGHSMESLSVSAAKLATHAIHGPAIIWSRWFRVGVFDAVRRLYNVHLSCCVNRLLYVRCLDITRTQPNGAGLRLTFGFCLRVEECCIGSNPGANGIGLHATADVNNLDVINSLFHGSHQYAAILISGGAIQDSKSGPFAIAFFH